MKDKLNSILTRVTAKGPDKMRDNAFQQRTGIFSALITFYHMRILNMYIFRTVGTTFAMALLIVTFMMLMGSFVTIFDLIFKKFSFIIILQFFATSLPAVICYALPFSMAASSLLVYSRLSADGEITAMKANGVSVFRIAAPTLILSIVVAIISLFMYNNVLPRAHFARDNIMASYQHQDPSALIETGKWTPLRNFRLLVDTKEGDTYRNITIVEDLEDKRVRRINAQHGNVSLIRRENRILFELYEVVTEERSPDHPNSYLSAHTSQVDLYIDMGSLVKKGKEIMKERKKPDDLTTEELREHVRERWRKIDEVAVRENISKDELLHMVQECEDIWSSLRGMEAWQKVLAAKETNHKDAKTDIIGRNMYQDYYDELVQQAGPSREIVSLFQKWRKMWLQNIHKGGSVLNDMEYQSRFRTKINYRLSYALATIAFAIIGIPLGIRAHRSEKTIGIPICIAVIAVHYAMVIAAQSFNDVYEFKPYYLIWLPDIVFIITGTILLWRNHRHS